jgi:hypothetical protein
MDTTNWNGGTTAKFDAFRESKRLYVYLSICLSVSLSGLSSSPVKLSSYGK